jgi:hypothetical protein
VEVDDVCLDMSETLGLAWTPGIKMNENMDCCFLLTAISFLCSYFSGLQEVLPWMSVFQKKIKKETFPFALGHLLSTE